MAGAHSNELLDSINRKLLRLLQANARSSFSELGRAVGLSAPAVAERVRRLEEAGVITGYHAAVNPAKVGLELLAFMRLSEVGERGERVADLVRELPEVIECHRVTGSDSYILKIAAASVAHLEALIDRFNPYGQITTALVLSSAVERHQLEPPER
ncbi:MAG TPA: Lrp/AsnC family transcriptional regulator [Kouleothrix sp.]|uniref:Lrp/AsnC family transcriptional regulator n=1 Tax=Kouleothrix sp. TaxID=2779161 RepID=UPI002CB9DFA4|nr:Lrp/AsnC family transcriptional regulator [Kouleothrix sp.]HRC76551.1 Lrp/AsnC family transcriptional regulator [Kouleothrix sp.]